ncbi:MAG: sigma-70 family RNA polymerase sigma factor [Nevskia sp.]|nr:sigma-70 family RNA polymerase sigma factor [Nevskia sp.]
MSGDLSDEELMLRFAAGGAAWAFEQLWNRNLGTLKRHLLRLCGDEPAAEDLAQEVWVRIFGAAARYQPRARFRTYMLQIAHNLFVDWYRKKGRSADSLSWSDDEGSAIADTLPDPAPGPPVAIDRQQQKLALQSAIADLPPAQREVMVLCLEGCELAEAAEILGRPYETVKTQYRYGLAKLKRRALGTAAAAA